MGRQLECFYRQDVITDGLLYQSIKVKNKDRNIRDKKLSTWYSILESVSSDSCRQLAMSPAQSGAVVTLEAACRTSASHHSHHRLMLIHLYHQQCCYHCHTCLMPKHPYHQQGPIKLNSRTFNNQIHCQRLSVALKTGKKCFTHFPDTVASLYTKYLNLSIYFLKIVP